MTERDWELWGVRCTVEQKKLFNDTIKRVAKTNNLSNPHALTLIIQTYNTHPDIIKANLQYYKDQYIQLQKDIDALIKQVNQIE